METTGLQRSTTSFRRQGSSGLVWDDKQFLAGGGGVNNNQEKTSNNKSADASTMMRRSRSEGGGSTGSVYRTVAKTASPSIDPPSPKVSGCGFCGVFSKPEAAAGGKKRRSTKRKS